MRRTADYHFNLPAEAIAQRPVESRDQSRLLHLLEGACSDLRFCDLPAVIPDDAVLVINDTKVIKARLRARKESGGRVELLLVEPTENPGVWLCLAKASKPIRDGCRMQIEDSDAACVSVGDRQENGNLLIRFSEEVFSLLERNGELPLPPYIERAEGTHEDDLQRYQTIYADSLGAVAAPTAGLHFTPELFASLRERGVSVAKVTLHVGLGTFAPVRAETLDKIVLHEERYHIPSETAALIESGRPIVAVGTTVVRTLESAARDDGSVATGEGRTSIFISPGYKWKVVDSLVTNFHLPSSTLLMLVCAFGGYAEVMAAYEHALSNGYRFYSYGDAMLLHRKELSL